MSGDIKRRVRALEQASGTRELADAKRWLEWNESGRIGPEPPGQAAANRLMRRALMALADD